MLLSHKIDKEICDASTLSNKGLHDLYSHLELLKLIHRGERYGLGGEGRGM
jgi:hypothetical protein